MSIHDSRKIEDVKVMLIKGADGNSISTIEKTSTSGLVDTYTVTLTDGSQTTFTVTNGSSIESITKTSTSGLTDTYTVTLTNGETSTFQVTNTRQSIRFSSFIMVPLMFGLASIAQPMVSILLTDKWLPCVPFLQWFCLVYLFQPIHTANMQAIKAIGRSDVYLKLEIVKKSIELLSLLAVMRISVSAIVINMAVLTTLFTFINAYPNHKLLAYNFKEQMSDILPAISMSAIMSLGVYFVGLIPMNAYVSLALQILLGAIIYLSLAWISNNKELQYFIQKIKVVANK